MVTIVLCWVPSCSETAQEKGIVFIIDFRDSQLSDVRYVASVVSVLKDGYPIHTKMIYVVSTKRLSRIIFAFQRMVKFDLNKVLFSTVYTS